MHSSLQNLVALSTDINGDRGLPVASYSDPDWLAKEREAILDKGWYYIGLKHNLANPGDVIVGHAGRVPVLVSRERSGGTLHAVVNVCRHRGYPVCQKDGNHSVLSCPYHGWTYELDGSLRKAPGTNGEYDKSEVSLPKLRLETWGPMVFVSPDPKAPALAEHFPDFEAISQLRAFNLDPEAYVFHRRYHSDIRANWKIWYDNTLECFHCPHVHSASFNDAYAVDPADYECLIRERLVSYYFPPKPQRSNDQLQVTWNKHMHLFPGFFVTQQDDIMLVHQMRVIDENTTHVFWDILAEKGADMDRVERWCSLWEETLEEDKNAVETVHANINELTFSANRYAPAREPVPQHINRWILDAFRATSSITEWN